MIHLKTANPFSSDQEALMSVRKFVQKDCASDKIRYEIDIKSRKVKPDFCEVECRITEVRLENDAWVDGDIYCQVGYAPRIGRDMDALIRAELCAITQCLAEMGLDVSFDDSNGEPQSYAISSWSKKDVLSAINVEWAIKEMERRGLDTKDVIQFRNTLAESGERLTKNKLADFLFPNDIALIPPSDKRPAKRVEIEVKTIENHKAQRDASEAEKIHKELTSCGITDNEFQNSSFKVKYSSLLLFSFAASDDEILALKNEHNTK